jgi:hypothetical protein
MVQSVDDLRKGAEERLSKSRRSMAEAIEGRRPASYEDVRELKTELRAISRRLDAIEERLPKRAPAKRSTSKRSTAKGSSATRSSAKRSS